MDQALTDYQVAAMLGVSRGTLKNWRYEGGGPPFEKCGRAVRYRASAVERWRRENTYRRTHEPVSR